jgi:hypothetical protein
MHGQKEQFGQGVGQIVLNKNTVMPKPPYLATASSFDPLFVLPKEAKTPHESMILSLDFFNRREEARGIPNLLMV